MHLNQGYFLSKQWGEAQKIKKTGVTTIALIILNTEFLNILFTYNSHSAPKGCAYFELIHP